MSDGYGFVPLPERVRREVRAHETHARRAPGTLRARFDLEFRADEPIHVGSGSVGLVDGSVVRLATRIAGRPGIPGSSLRGVLRARIEAITNSCCPTKPPKEVRLGKGLPSRTYPDHRVCFTHAAVGHDVFTRCFDRSKDAWCLACSLFGRTGHRSRVSVRDFVVQAGESFKLEKMPQRFSPRPHHLGEFEVRPGQVLEVTRLHGRKFAMNDGPQAGSPELVEAIPAGAQLTGTLLVTNALPPELGAVVTGLGHLPPSFLKIGSGKAHRFGRLRLTRIEVTVQEGARSRVAPLDDLRGWRAAFENDAGDRFAAGEESLLQLHRLEGDGR